MEFALPAKDSRAGIVGLNDFFIFCVDSFNFLITVIVMDTQIIDKLRKMLSLSKDATGAEAETALLMATKLATKYEIDISAIQPITPEKKEEMVKEKTVVGKRLPVCHKWVAWLLNEHFKVRIIYGGNRYFGRTVYFLGRKSDVEFAKYVNDFLVEHIMRSWRYYQKANNIPTSHRFSFIDGFYDGLNNKIKTSKKNQEDESFQGMESSSRESAENRYQLALISEKEERDAFVKKSFVSLRAAKSYQHGRYDSNASSAGYAAGAATNIARPLN